MINIIEAKTNDTIVLADNDSFIIKKDNDAKTIAPTAKPINLPGQISPLNPFAEYSVNFIKVQDIGIPNKLMIKGFFLNHGMKN